MTCIAGLVHNGTVYMGGDSAGVAGLSLTVVTTPKVFKKDTLIIGYTSSFRMGDLLQYKFTPPLHDPNLDTRAYMVTAFVDAVRQCLKDGGYAKKENEVESAGQFLVGYRGRLFFIYDDYQVNEGACGYAVGGCGREPALGALFANAHLEPQARILQALEAAEMFNTGVRRPFYVEST